MQRSHYFVATAIVVTSVAATIATGAAAQAYPQRPIQIVVPTSAGGGVDMVARTIGEKLSAALGQSVLVDNRPGAGGAIGVGQVAKAAPDGYSLLVASSSHVAINPNMARVPFDPMRDLAPISLIASAPLVLVVHPSVPVKSVQDLIALAKAKKGMLNYGSAGIGTTSHVGVELFKSMTETDIVHIPFKGNSLATVALLSGEIDVMLNSPTNALPQIRNGRLKGLGIATLKRSKVVPGLPTIAEAGVPGFEVGAWYAMLAPAGTPEQIIVRISKEIANLTKLPDVQKRLASDGLDPVGSSPEEFARYLKSELAKWARVIKSANITNR